MQWKKKGLIYCPNAEDGWKVQSAMLPTPILLGDKLRVFLGICDKDNVGRIGYVDVDPRNPSKILDISSKPILDIGRKGCFDDNGVVPISILRDDKKIYVWRISN